MIKTEEGVIETSYSWLVRSSDDKLGLAIGT